MLESSVYDLAAYRFPISRGVYSCRYVHGIRVISAPS